MIVIADNLVSEQDAMYCIDKVGDGKINPSEIFFGRYVYDIKTVFGDDRTIISLIKNIEATANQFYPNIEVDWAQFVLWPTGTQHELHYDAAATDTVFTSITYLNCAYRGGETFFGDGTSISPVVGRTVFFDGNKYLHGVQPISHGVRITLPIWYKIKPK
jgi:hypothetical protein